MAHCYKVFQLLQSVTEFIAKCVRYYKVCRGNFKYLIIILHVRKMVSLMDRSINLGISLSVGEDEVSLVLNAVEKFVT